MKKPLHKITLVLWIVAGLTVALDLVQVWQTLTGIREVSHGEPFLVLATVTRTLVGVALQIALLIGLGAIIELLDQIRWDAKSKS